MSSGDDPVGRRRSPAAAPPGGDTGPGGEGGPGVAGGERRELDERPPFGSWRLLYAIVLGALGAQVIVYALVQRLFR